MDQRSPEWFAARCGSATASRISDIVATTKSGPSASRQNYLAQLVAERLTGTVTDAYSNAAMQHGTETEPEARAAYEFVTGQSVTEVAYCMHPRIRWSGASPDGLVGDDGLVEIKCPNTATHIDTLLKGAVPGKYMVQMQWQMACTGRGWCDWVSYDPRLPQSMRLFVKRVERDDKQIGELEDAVRAFLTDVEKTVADLKAKFGT